MEKDTIITHDNLYAESGNICKRKEDKCDRQ